MTDLTRRTLFGLAGLGFAEASAWAAQAGATQPDQAGAPGGALLRATDFGAVGDGVADDTDALVALFAAMQGQGRPGLLGGGGAETRYLVRTGDWRWTFDNSPAVAPPGPAGPTLFTAGKVTIVAGPGGRDAPLLSIHNDPAAGSRFVHGGYVGPLWFEDPSGGGEGRHGLSLYGVEFMRFGPMFSSRLAGDLIHIESHGDAVTADAWHVFACVFEGAATWNSAGWTFNNDSVSQVFCFNHIISLWNILGEKGIFRGPGANNVIDGVSCYQNRGWALDLVADVGSTQGLSIGGADLDAPEYGVRIDGLQFGRLDSIRIAHRSGEDRIPATVAWPREALRLGGPTSGTVTTDIRGTIQHRLSPDITPATQARLGSFADYSGDPTVAGVTIEHHLNPSVQGVRVGAGAFRQGVHRSPRGNLIMLDGRIIYDSRIKHALRAHAVGGAISNQGFLTQASKVPFAIANLDDGGNFDADGAEYVVPYAGYYRVRAQLRLAAGPGPVELAVMVRRDGHDALIAESVANGGGAGPATFAIECLDYFEESDRIWISARQNSGGARVALDAGASAPGGNRFEVAPL